jgi:hypothetical protein
VTFALDEAFNCMVGADFFFLRRHELNELEQGSIYGQCCNRRVGAAVAIACCVSGCVEQLVLDSLLCVMLAQLSEKKKKRTPFSFFCQKKSL